MKAIGFIGLGNMGGGMVKNLVGKGFDVLAYDISAEALERAVSHGVRQASGVNEVIEECDQFHTCLVGDVSLRLVESVISRVLREGHIHVDHSTLGAPDARRLAASYQKAGATYLDVPISGGRAGSDAGTLRMFAGGDEAAFRKALPALHAMANAHKIIYGGESGRGQAIKIMQQLTGRLLKMARMEIIAFGVREGFDDETIARILDIDLNGDDAFASAFRQIRDRDVDTLTCLFPEWKYYLAEAHDQDIPLPMLEGAWDFYSAGERSMLDVVSRESVNLWQELMDR